MARRVQAVAAQVRRAPSTPRASFSLIALPLVGLAAITLFELSNWDRIVPGVSALGTPVGGMSRTDAAAQLGPVVQRLLDRPLDISADAAGQTWHTTARELGLRLDPDELAAAAYQVGRQGNPFERLADQLGTLLRGQSVSVSSTTDAAALDTAVRQMAEQIDRSPTDARLALAGDGSLQFASAEPGLSVDVDASREAVTAALSGRDESVALVTRAIPPTVTDDQLEPARSELEHLLGPEGQGLTVTFGEKSWQLQRADLARLISLNGSGVNIDDKPLQTWAAGLAKDVDQTVQDARLAFNGGNLKVLRPSRQGRRVDQSALVSEVHEALTSGQTSIELPVSTVDPAVSSDDPQSLGITEVIDRGSTSFAGSIPEKAHNIKLASERLNGIVVPPGATFSFNDAIGPTTLDAGFQWGFGIASGNDGPRTVPSVAGGICQVATTLFQPVFWAGYQLEQRFWHLYWIPAYTSRGVVGLDVTVDSDAGLDFKWTNTTSNYILIQSATDDANIYFGLYGKKPPWKVQVDDAIITNRTPPDPKPVAQEEPTLPWGRSLLVETARDGFDAEVVRHVIPSDGSKPRDLDLKSSYEPARTVTLVGSAGKPANASIDDAIQRVLDAQKPAPSPTPAAQSTSPSASPAASPTGAAASPNGTMQPTGTNAPAAGSTQSQATAAAVPAVAKPAATPTAVPRNQPVGPAPTAKPQATTRPAGSNSIAATPTPGH